MTVRLPAWLDEELRREFAERDEGPSEGLREHFGWLDQEALEAALDFHERFPDRVDALIEENERIGRRLAERLG